MVKVLLTEPALIVTDTLRSSYPVFSSTVNFTFAVPLLPLVVEALHQVAPLVVEATDKVQLVLTEKETVCSPDATPKDKPLETILESMVISALTSSGFGVGLTGSSLPPSLQLAQKHVSMASIKIAFFIIRIMC